MKLVRRDASVGRQDRVEEGDIEEDVVPDEKVAARPVEERDGRVLRGRRGSHVGLGDAVDLLAEDAACRSHERGPAIGDRAVRDAHGADLDDLAALGVVARRLDIEHDERAARLDGGDEVHDRVGRGLDERDVLRLADEPLELLLEVDDRRERAVAEHDRVGHDRLGQDLGAGLDHHDRVAGARDDEVELRLRQLAHRGVDDELAVDATDAHGRDRAEERDVADRERGRRGDRPEDVGVVLLVGREHRQDAAGRRPCSPPGTAAGSAGP